MNPSTTSQLQQFIPSTNPIPQLDWVCKLDHFTQPNQSQLNQFNEWKTHYHTLHNTGYNNNDQSNIPQHLQFTHPIPLQQTHLSQYYQNLQSIPRINSEHKTSTQLIQDLQGFMIQNGALFDPRCECRATNHDANNTGIWGIFATNDIPAYTTIAIIPYSLTLNSIEWNTIISNHLQTTPSTNSQSDLNPQFLPQHLIYTPDISLPIKFFIELCNYQQSFFRFYFDTLLKFTPHTIPLESVNWSPLSNLSTDSKSTLNAFVKNEEYELFLQIQQLIQQYIPKEILRGYEYNWEVHKYIYSILHSRSLLNTNTNLIRPIEYRCNNTFTDNNNNHNNNDWDSVLIPWIDMVNHSTFPNIAYFTLPHYSNGQLPTESDLTTDQYTGSSQTSFYFTTTCDIKQGDELTLDYIGSEPFHFPKIGPMTPSKIESLSQQLALTPLHIAINLTQTIEPFTTQHQSSLSSTPMSTNTSKSNPATSSSKRKTNSKSIDNKHVTFLQQQSLKSNPLSKISIDKLLQQSLCRYPLLHYDDFSIPLVHHSFPSQQSFFHYNILPYSTFQPYLIDSDTEANTFNRYFIHPWVFSDFSILSQIMLKAKEYYQQSLTLLGWDHIVLDNEYLTAFQMVYNSYFKPKEQLKQAITKNGNNDLNNINNDEEQSPIAIAPLPFDTDISKYDHTMMKFLSNCFIEIYRNRFESLPPELIKRYETTELYRHEINHKEFLQQHNMIRQTTQLVQNQQDILSTLSSTLPSTSQSSQANDINIIETNLTPDATILIHTPNGIDFDYTKLENGGFNTPFLSPENQGQAINMIYPYSFSLTTISPAIQALCYFLASLACGCPTEIIPLLLQNTHFISNIEILRHYTDQPTYINDFFEPPTVHQCELLHLPARCILLAIMSTLITLQHPTIQSKPYNSTTQPMVDNPIKTNNYITIPNDQIKSLNNIQFSSFFPLTTNELQIQYQTQLLSIQLYENIPNYIVQHIFNVVATSIGVLNQYWDLDSIPTYKEQHLKLPTNLKGPGTEHNFPFPDKNDTVIETPVSHFGWWKSIGFIEQEFQHEHNEIMNHIDQDI